MREHLVALHPRLNAKVRLASRECNVCRTRVIVAAERWDDDWIATTLRFMRRRAPAVVDVRILHGVERYDTAAVELDADLLLSDVYYVADIAV